MAMYYMNWLLSKLEMLVALTPDISVKISTLEPLWDIIPIQA
jgi:hypothetical protein